MPGSNDRPVSDGVLAWSEWLASRLMMGPQAVVRPPSLHMPHWFECLSIEGAFRIVRALGLTPDQAGDHHATRQPRNVQQMLELLQSGMASVQAIARGELAEAANSARLEALRLVMRSNLPEADRAIAAQLLIEMDARWRNPHHARLPIQLSLFGGDR